MPPPKQKPTTPILPVQSGRSFSHFAEARKSSQHLLPVYLSKDLRAFFVIARITADAGQAIGSEGHETRRAQAPRYILDVRI